MIPLVDVKAQYAPLIPELKERFAEVLESGRFIFGPEAWRRSSARPPRISASRTPSGSPTEPTRSCLLEAMEIGPGDEVICPSFTF